MKLAKFSLHCTARASTSRVLNNCVIAKLTRRVFINYFEHKGCTHRLLSEDTYLSFFWWDPKVFDFRTYKELWLV